MDGEQVEGDVIGECHPFLVGVRRIPTGGATSTITGEATIATAETFQETRLLLQMSANSWEQRLVCSLSTTLTAGRRRVLILAPS